MQYLHCVDKKVAQHLTKNAADIVRPAPPGSPIHTQVYEDLRARILFGEIAPGQNVTINGLASVLGAGITPVREAIRRLISDGALQFRDNRRVCVPTLSAADLDQLLIVRNAVETELARRAATRVTQTLLDELRTADRRLDAAILAGDVSAYLRWNYAFHSRLYAAAHAPILTDFADRLWLRFGPSMRVVCGRLGTKSLPDRHKDILTALQDRDAEAAAKGIERDIAQGNDLISAALGPAGRFD